MAKRTQPKAKAHAGCARCRKSHVKCDEKKPACGRCFRTDSQCVYLTPTRATSRLDTRQILPAGSAESIPPRPHLLQFSCRMLEPGEVLYYDRFRDQVARQMSFQAEGPVDFWLRSVLRESTVDGCILDAILGIGALAYAQDQATVFRPLFLAPQPDEHYYQALSHYNRAIVKLRDCIADTPGGVSRTMIIATVLFSFFEYMQGNTTGADTLTGRGIMLLKDDVLLPDSSPRSTRTDDEGIEEAKYFLVRTACWTVQQSPMYPCQRESLLEIANKHTFKFPSPNPRWGTREFCSTFWRMVTVGSLWQVRAFDYLYNDNPTATHMLESEYAGMVRQVSAWETAAGLRLGREKDMEAYAMVAAVYLGAKFLVAAIHGTLDPAETVWNTKKELGLHFVGRYTYAANSGMPSYARAIINDALLAGVSRVVLSCRDADVRHGALGVWKQLVNRKSSWDIKSTLMGACALVSVEEAARDEDGCIPHEARYDWTSGTWNKDHTEFLVNLTARYPEPDKRRRQKQVVMRPEDLDLV
ncbi:hypothetical protein V2G26_010701 [Clonostachys chloroleuca]